ncbi:MAG: histidine kinase N-terminal 7TM domain-containing protein [Cyanobacteria bacterium P01_D01_bin.1]
MLPAYLLVAILPAIATCLSGSISLYAWQRREVNGSREFALFSASISIWCFFAVFEQLSSTELQQVTFGRAQYLGIPALPVFWFLFTLRHTEHDGWLSRSVLKAFSVIPLLSVLLASTDHWHGWIWESVRFQSQPFPKLIISHGWWFNSVMIPHTYVLILSGIGVLLSAAFTGSRLRRQQTLMLVSAILFTFFVNIVYLIADITLYGLDPTPIGFAVTTLFIQFGLFHTKFLEVAPISYKTAFLNTTDALILLDRRRRIVDLNPSALIESQRTRSSISAIGQPFDHVFPDYRRLFEKIDNKAIELTEVLKFSRPSVDSPSAPSVDSLSAQPVNSLNAPSANSLNAQPQAVYRQVKVRSILTADGRQGGWVIIIRDVTLEKQQQAQLEKLAYVDNLTGLSNRRQLELKAEELLACDRVHYVSIALLYIDLNRFKLINDSYGHDVGDAVLQHVARCLTRSVRKGDMVVRLGGDEFVAVLYAADAGVALEVRSRLVDMLNQTVSLAGHQLTLSASVGAAYYPEDGSTLSSLLRQADQNMYRDKQLS